NRTARLRPRLIARPERRCRRSELPKVGLPQCPSEKKGQTAPLARVTSLLSSPCTRRARRNRGPPRPQPWNSLQRQTPRWRERDSNHRSRVTRPTFRGRLMSVGPRQRKSRREREPTARGRRRLRGTDGSNPASSSSQSVLAVNPEAIGEKPRTLAAVCGWLGT